tara:strand:+ start:1197 stop:1778 length:582 start_codon:yes stop_codon:yes gene_type:complete
MPSKRTGYAPWSLTREAGVLSATVDGTIEVPQSVQPTIRTGFCDEKGNWVGEKSSDNNFFGFTKHLVVPNTNTVLAPSTGDIDRINMEGFNALQLAVRVTRTGAFTLTAVMGPDTNSFLNIQPVNAAGVIRIIDSISEGWEDAVNDAESCIADVWEIFTITTPRLRNQNNLQFKITNGSGGNSDIEVAFRRLV